MDDLDFTEEEIQEQLSALGYKNISKHRLQQFKQDLDELIQNGKWKTVPSARKRNSSTAPTVASRHCPPAYTKEKVTRCPLKYSDGFYLHPSNNGDNRQVFSAHQTRDYRRDPYANHSLAPKPLPPVCAPSRQQVDSDSEDTLRHSFTDSYTSSPSTQGRPFIKRKVLRKHRGQSLVCDESVYSEDSAPSLSPHISHTSARGRITSMYKMYSTQLDEESDDDSSSFWSDGEKQDDVEKVERVLEEEGSGPGDKAGQSLNKTSEEDKPEQIHQEDSHRESLEDGTDDEQDYDDHEDDGDQDYDDHEEDYDDHEEEDDEQDYDDQDHEDNEDEESCSSGSDSPAPSLMTSGYGTYRPEEQEAGSYRDDHTMTELDQDSRGDLSEMRDDDDRSLCSFGGFDIESMREPGDEPEANMECDEDDCVRNKDVSLEEERSHTDEQEAENNNMTDAVSEQKHHDTETQDGSSLQQELVKDECDPVEGTQHEMPEDVQQQLRGHKGVEDKVESEDPDETSSNKDIKFIDSKVDFSWMPDEQWEGNLRRKKDATSCLEEKLADLHLSTSARRDTQTRNEDQTSQSDTCSSEDGISLSAFESYLQGVTRSLGDFKPKPKSFIRPVMSQQTIKKTDPVAKYFQYKQLWEMFKPPGEKDRKALRWEIREQLAYQPPPPKPRRVYLPNTYIIPTEKKRSGLRWEIRNNLANGLIPHKFNY